MTLSVSGLIELVRTFRHIDRSAVSPEIKAKLKKTYFWTFFLKRYDPASRTADIAGYRFKYCTYKVLA